jgi:succinate dehydrogenase hydrophobic anchor subunit
MLMRPNSILPDGYICECLVLWECHHLSILFDITALMVTIMISVIEGCCSEGNHWPKSSYWLNWRQLFERFTVVTMTWLTVTVYLYHIWLGISFICRNHNQGLSLFTTYHRVCNKITTTGATCGEGTTFSSGSPRCLVLLLDILFCAWCVLDHCLSFSQPYQLHPLYFYQLNRPITMPSVCFSYCL